MGRWFIGLVVLGVLTIVLGIFMLTLQVCVLAIAPALGEPECIRWAPAFLFSGSMTIFLGGMMVLSGAVTWGD